MNTIQLFTFFIAGIIIAYICNLLLLRFSESLGIRNKNDVVIRWSNQSKPSLGGVSFFVVFIFSCFAYLIAFKDQNIFDNPAFRGVFIAGTLAFVMGLSDDAYNTKPLLKLGVQILCGVILVFYGEYIHLSNIFLIDAALTVFWVVLLMNSLNMLDNMDGITGTVVLFILITTLISCWMFKGINVNIWSTINIAMIGGLIGFLYFNIHPSKLFMGDAGSQFIGFFVAFMTIDNLWNIGHSYQLGTEVGLFLILISFTVPFSDTLTVVINRLKKGQSPMVGGKDHTTHHLVYAGLNDRQVWYVFLALSILFATLSLVAIILIKHELKLVAYSFTVLSGITFILLYRNTLKFPSKKN